MRTVKIGDVFECTMTKQKLKVIFNGCGEITMHTGKRVLITILTCEGNYKYLGNEN